MRRRYRYAAGLLLLGLTAVLGAGVWLVTTTAGAQWLLTRVPGIAAHLTGGSLLHGLAIDALDWRSGGNRVAVRHVSSRWDSRCFLRLRWCVSELQVGALELALVGAETTEPAAAAPPNIALPFAVELDTARLEKLSIVLDGQRLDFSAIETRLRLEGSDVVVDYLRVRHELGHAELAGRLTARDDYPLEASLEAEFVAPGLQHAHTLSTSLSGSLDTLSVTAALEGPLVRAGKLTSQGSVRALEQPPAYETTLRWQRLGWPLEGTAAFSVHDGEVRLSGAGTDYRLALSTRADVPTLPDASVKLEATGNDRAVQIQALALQHPRVEASTSGRLALVPDPGWQGELRLQRLDLGHWVEAAEAPVSGRTELAVSRRADSWLAQVTQLRLDSRLAGFPVQLAGSLNVDSAGHWDTPALNVASGANRARVQGQGVVDPATLEHDIDLALSWDALTWPPGSPATLVSRNGALRLSGHVDDYRLSGGLSLSGPQVPDTALELAVQGNRQRVSVTTLRAATLEGVVEARGELTPSTPATWSASADFERLNPAAQWPDLTGRLGGRVLVDGQLGEAWAVRLQALEIDGEFRGGAFTLDARGAGDKSGYVRIDTLELRSGGNTVSVSGERQTRWALRGSANLSDPAMLLPGAAGTLEARFQIDGELINPDVSLQLAGENLAAAGAMLRTLRVEAELKALGQGVSSITLSGAQASRDGVEVDSVEATLTGTREDHELRVRVDAEALGLDWRTRGSLTEPLAWQGDVSAAEVTALQQTWRLGAPVALRWAPGTDALQVPAHCWEQDAARLCLSAPARVGAGGTAQVRLAAFDVATLQSLLPDGTSLQGRLGAQAEVTWHPDERPSLQLEASLSGGAIQRRAGDAEPPLSVAFEVLKLQGALRAGTLSADVQLRSPSLGTLSASVAIEASDADRPLRGELALESLDLGVVQPFFPQVTQLAGVVSARGRLAGSVRQPSFHGNLNVTGFALAGSGIPLALSDGEVGVDVDGTRASFQGRATSGNGEVRVDGTAQWQTDSWQLALRVTGRDVGVRQEPLLDARVTPDLEVAVRPGVVSVAGELFVPFARITVRDLPPDATRVSRDVVVVDAQAPADDFWRIETRIRLRLGDDVRFKGLGLRAKLSGDVRLVQSDVGTGRASGEIRIDEGDYKAYAQDLRITEGRLLFVGPLDRPDVSLTAVREVGSVTVGLRVQGPIERPETTLFSTPPQTETNTLSYLVLGRPLQQDSKEDGQVLTQAALALGLSGGGRGLATQVAEQFGISEFEIEARSDDAAGPQVVLRGRLSPNLVVRYGVSVLTPVNTLTLQYELTERLYVEAAQGLESALDLFYSFDF